MTKRDLDLVEARKTFLRIGKSIDEDASRGFFRRTNEVSWMVKQPETAEEVSENLFERLRAFGVTFSLNTEEADHYAIIQASVIRSKKES